MRHSISSPPLVLVLTLPDTAADSTAQTDPAAAAYLAKLNEAQRRAVEFGVDKPGRCGGPLLVIAGAGKTNTLAHRVAHLLVKGADPHRILLLTFSRRAAPRSK